MLTTNQVEGDTKPPSVTISRLDFHPRVRSFFQVMTPYRYTQIMHPLLVATKHPLGPTELIRDSPVMEVRMAEPKLLEIMPKTF